jgi:O-antigen biosynthesis protein
VTPDAPTPEISVVLPAYDSHSTIARCLASMIGQEGVQFEVIVVDSGPVRLLPQAARRTGLAFANGSLIVFSDPDCYAEPGWLAALARAHRETGAVIVGALACHGDSLWDHAIHLCKFSKWLPGGKRRPIDMGPTANLLIPRDLLAATGDLAGEPLLGDVELSRAVIDRGVPLLFEPTAVVSHHHEQSVGSFWRERFQRGVLFGAMRAEWLGKPRCLGMLIASILPIRLLRIALLVALQSARGGKLLLYTITAPLVLGGHLASLLGEAKAYARAVFG